MSKIDEASDEGSRRQLIQESLAKVGKTWAASWFVELSTDSRNVEGGWPGRLAEARALAMRELPKELAQRGMAPPSASEMASAPAAVNEHARKEWLRVSKRKNTPVAAPPPRKA